MYGEEDVECYRGRERGKTLEKYNLLDRQRAGLLREQEKDTELVYERAKEAARIGREGE